MGASQRRKGAAWEREVATRMKPVYPEAKRGLAQPRSARECPDVTDTPWWVETKKGARVNVLAALRQAIDATDGRPPLVVVGQDRQPPFVAMLLDDFLKLVGQPAQLRADKDCEWCHGTGMSPVEDGAGGVEPCDCTKR